MPGRIDIALDAPTSRAVAQGIGEKLRQTLGTEAGFPDKLQELLDELHRRETGQHEIGQPVADRKR
jgi:hypothetical protein